jgi:hypothetical protein
MDFLNHGEGGMVSSFLLYRNCKILRELEEIEISSKAVEVTVNNKEEIFRLLSGFRPRIRPLHVYIPYPF